jgi:deoxycytidine triphosphate deaminase
MTNGTNMSDDPKAGSSDNPEQTSERVEPIAEADKPGAVIVDTQDRGAAPNPTVTEQPEVDNTPLPIAGILAADDILKEIESNGLIKNGVPENVQASSYDMRIGTIFRDGRIIKGTQGVGDQVLLDPGEIISIFTLEELDLPDYIAGTAFSINALSSEGLLVLNPGHIDPGFKGPLTVRAINLRATRKAIDLETPIFTVIFERLPKATTRPYSKYIARHPRELKFNSNDVEQNPGSLGRLVMLGKDRPLVTPEEVNKLIIQHWMSWMMIAGTITAVVLAAIAAIFAIIGVYKTEPSRPIDLNSNSAKSLPSPIPSTEPVRQNTNSDQKGMNVNANLPANVNR